MICPIFLTLAYLAISRIISVVFKHSCVCLKSCFFSFYFRGFLPWGSVGGKYWLWRTTSLFVEDTKQQPLVAIGAGCVLSVVTCSWSTEQKSSKPFKEWDFEDIQVAVSKERKRAPWLSGGKKLANHLCLTKRTYIRVWVKYLDALYRKTETFLSTIWY